MSGRRQRAARCRPLSSVRSSPRSARLLKPVSSEAGLREQFLKSVGILQALPLVAAEENHAHVAPQDSRFCIWPLSSSHSGDIIHTVVTNPGFGVPLEAERVAPQKRRLIHERPTQKQKARGCPFASRQSFRPILSLIRIYSTTAFRAAFRPARRPRAYRR